MSASSFKTTHHVIRNIKRLPEVIPSTAVHRNTFSLPMGYRESSGNALVAAGIS
jgi:hypothetical protein